MINYYQHGGLGFCVFGQLSTLVYHVFLSKVNHNFVILSGLGRIFLFFIEFGSNFPAEIFGERSTSFDGIIFHFMVISWGKEAVR